MASVLPRAAFRATRVLRDQVNHAERSANAEALKVEAKRNPELYVLFGIVGTVVGGAGFYLASNPTSHSGGKEKAVAKIEGTEPWKTGKWAQYQYHPHGDTSAPRKDAPGPLHVSIIPNVNLPKDLHDQFNKYGKDDYP